MDDKTLRKTLNQLVEQEIPDDMNIIPNVREQLQATQRVTRRRSLRVATVMAALLIFSTMTVAAAVVLYQQDNDPGLNAVDEQGLFTELDLSQTINDMTVEVLRGYADANRVALNTVISYDMTVFALPESGLHTEYTLIDANTGSIIQQAPFGAGSGGGAPDVAIREITQNLSYDMSALDITAETLDLRLEVSFSPTANIGSGGGGGGGGADQQVPTPLPVPTRIPDAEFEPFTISFDFSLPFIAEYIVPQSELEPVTSADVTMRVDNLSITPSLTNFVLCYTLSESNLLWIPYVVIITPEGEFGHELDLPLETATGAEEVCAETAISVPYTPGSEAEWTLDVRYLRSTFAATQANADALVELLAEQGIAVDIFGTVDGEQTFRFAMGMRGTVDLTQEEMQSILSEAYVTLGESIDGTWAFTFSLP